VLFVPTDRRAFHKVSRVFLFFVLVNEAGKNRRGDAGLPSKTRRVRIPENVEVVRAAFPSFGRCCCRAEDRAGPGSEEGAKAIWCRGNSLNADLLGKIVPSEGTARAIRQETPALRLCGGTWANSDVA